MPQFYLDFSEWLRSHLHVVAPAQVATLLAVFGRDIGQTLRNLLQEYPFVVRVAGFTAVYGCGYGLAIFYFGAAGAKLLTKFSPKLLPLVVVAIFVGIGLLAEHKNKI